MLETPILHKDVLSSMAANAGINAKSQEMTQPDFGAGHRPLPPFVPSPLASWGAFGQTVPVQAEEVPECFAVLVTLLLM